MTDVIELKILINKVLLPRIRQLEEEVASLRKHTWPYVQGKKEAHQLHDIEMKADFLKHLDDDTIVALLRTKAELSGKSGFITREYDSIHNNFCWRIVDDIYSRWWTYAYSVSYMPNHLYIYHGEWYYSCFTHPSHTTNWTTRSCLLCILYVFNQNCDWWCTEAYLN